jgi:hypothetical protein
MRVVSLPRTGLVVSVTSFVPGLFGFQQQAAIRSEPRLDRRVPAPDRSRYGAICEERDWRNPHLLASHTGFELRSLSAPEPRVVLLKDLRRVLTELPISDWPYCSVVVVQSPGIVEAANEWVAAMQRNIDEARTLIKALGADVWGWPSA